VGEFLLLLTIFLAPTARGEDPAPVQAATPSVLTLAEAERLALRASPALKAAEARIRLEEGRLRQAGLYPNPDLSLDSSWFTDGSGSRETILSFRQPIAYPRKRDLEKKEAMERIEGARHDRERERLEILLEAREAYYRIHFAHEVLKVEEEDLEATRAVRQAVDARVATGDAAPFESLKASVEVSRAESEVSRARGELAAETARQICKVEPSSDLGPVLLAQSLHKLARTTEARDVLLGSLDQFPDAYQIRYDLARYSCQMGDLAEACAWLAEAFGISGTAETRILALHDPDLEPLRKQFGEVGNEAGSIESPLLREWLAQKF